MLSAEIVRTVPKIVGARLFGAARYTAQSGAANSAPGKTVMWQMPQRVIFETFSDTQKERWTAGPLKADMVVAGRVFGRWGNALFAADIPDEGEAPEVSWSTVIDAVPISLAAADNKLFVMTVEGKLIVLSMEDAIHGADIVVNEEAAEDEEVSEFDADGRRRTKKEMKKLLKVQKLLFKDL